MIAILTWISIIAGGVLIVLLLLSIIGGLDLDLDVGDTEVDADGGGLGLVKGFLTFISVASWVIKVMLTMQQSTGLALVIGIISGAVAFLLLNYLLRLLIRNEENVNWSYEDAMMQRGEVYLKIPGQMETGLVNIEIKGVMRELKARAVDKAEIPTGSPVIVVDLDGDIVVVQKEQ